ncbi:MAG TPA: aminoacyl-tRNA hydrolase [Thermoflexales bacterium]|nr:aminoacyl-tRNA hydrolase [Thermoflexales bacterium]HQW37006.1 aminoacyl-tRNA hydrolase [Thermoflexales bacterium]HRA00494.1 aminoacyl-tRNA hydrolase [Thermoflexales bacterium]
MASDLSSLFSGGAGGGPERRIIAGLGNPGKEYAQTRHNAGFHALDKLAQKHGLTFTKMMSRGLVALGEIAGNKVALVKPQTFMNESGVCVGPVMKFFKSSAANLIVVYDELDIPPGSLRLRKNGGSGGHNGMKSIITHIGTQDFARLRVGIGRPPGRMDPAAFVLTPYAKSELELMQLTYGRAAESIERWMTEGIDRAMNWANAGTEEKD